MDVLLVRPTLNAQGLLHINMRHMAL